MAGAFLSAVDQGVRSRPPQNAAPFDSLRPGAAPMPARRSRGVGTTFSAAALRAMVDKQVFSKAELR